MDYGLASKLKACRLNAGDPGDPAHLPAVACCQASQGPSSLGDGEQCGLVCNIPDLDAPVQRYGSHLLAVRVKAAGCDRPFVMI